MPSSSSTSFWSIIGGFLLAHAAYSCLHFRSILADLDLDEYDNVNDGVRIPPVDVLVETGLGFLLLLMGELSTMGSLQSVDLVVSSSNNSKKRKPLVAPAYRTRDFDIYRNRSKMMAKATATSS